MIYVITGKTGHGKTAYAVKWVRDTLASGLTVYANTKINTRQMFSKKKYTKLFGDEAEGDIINPEDRKTKKVLYWQNFSDWQYFQKGLVLCDEGIVYFNARRWEALSDQMQMRLVQHRKDQLDLIVTVQHYTFIDKTIRMLCERFINVELKIGSPKFKKTFIPRISKVIDIDLPTLNKCENLGIDPYNATDEQMEQYKIQQLGSENFWIRKKIFGWYDTSAKMVESRPEELIHRMVVCPTCKYTKISHA